MTTVAMAGTGDMEDTGAMATTTTATVAVAMVDMVSVRLGLGAQDWL